MRWGLHNDVDKTDLADEAAAFAAACLPLPFDTDVAVFAALLVLDFFAGGADLIAEVGVRTGSKPADETRGKHAPHRHLPLPLSPLKTCLWPLWQPPRQRVFSRLIDESCCEWLAWNSNPPLQMYRRCACASVETNRQLANQLQKQSSYLGWHILRGSGERIRVKGVKHWGMRGLKLKLSLDATCRVTCDKLPTLGRDGPITSRS